MSLKKGLYKHFKGNYYQVIDVAQDSETQQEMVVYRALYGEKGLWLRPLDMFSEVIERDGVQHKRFSYCDEQTQVLEVAALDITQGRETEFEQTFAKVHSILSSMGGYISHQIQRCLEHNNRYILLVEWQTLEDHTIGFRGSDEYLQLQGVLQEFLSSIPSVLHYQELN